MRLTRARRYKTRHGPAFCLRSCRWIDPRRSCYARLYPGYPEMVEVLGKRVGTDQFLWAVEEEREMPYSPTKPVEWVVSVLRDRVLGYVNDDLWNEYLRGEQVLLDQRCFERQRPVTGDFSVLLSFPLRDNEIVCRRVNEFVNPHTPKVIREESLAEILARGR